MPSRTAFLLVAVSLALSGNHVASFSSPMPTAKPTTTTSTTSLSYASCERACVELTDPETGCEVVLVGCFHGSPSSAADVQREVWSAPTDVVALELCASRFDDLNRMMEKTEEEKKVKTPRAVRFVYLVGETIRTRGLSTGVATAVLGGVSGMQTALSGFTPGLEFSTAVEASKRQQQQTECDIILADQSVDETIEKVGKLPQVVTSMVQEIRQKDSNMPLEDTQWGKMASHLSTALAGDTDLLEANYQVNVPRVVTRSRESISEMARLMVPPVVFTQMALILVNQALFPEPMLDTNDGFLTLLLSFFWNPVVRFDPMAFVMDAIPHVLILSTMLTTAYAVLMVPVTQVILAERDDQLTDGIRAACRIANSKHQAEGKKGRVVAVLGLLHVNGVTKRMMAASETVQSKEVELSPEIVNQPLQS